MRTDYTKYLGIKHDYVNNNCATLINQIFMGELGSNVINKIWPVIDMPGGSNTIGKNFFKMLTFKQLTDWADSFARRVNLTELQEYDVILFKTKAGRPIHFGLYIERNKFIHLMEDEHSRIEELNDEWRNKIYTIYRFKCAEDINVV